MNRMSIAAVAALLLTALGLGALYWVQQRPRSAPVERSAPIAEAPADPASAPAEPAIRHPLDPALAASAPLPAPGDAQSQWRQALAEVIGRAAVTRFMQTENFAQRFVVTVDNLARVHAAPRLWPVQPTPGRFSVSGDGELRNVAAENAGRYTPFVTMATSIDARRAAAAYARMYPQLQSAYEELGYPNRYLNDRVVEVIDHLLATPEPPSAGPLMQLTEVKGSVPSTQPWLRYEFADPDLQALSSGQRILLRVGPAHRQALKAKLSELRGMVTRAPASR